MPVSLPQLKAKNITVSSRPLQVKKTTRKSLMACGCDEIVTLSLISTKALDKCLMQNLKQVKVTNPLSSEQELMRPSLLPSFMQVAAGNFNHGNKNLRLFEIAPRYFPDGERLTAAVLLTGSRYGDWRLSRKEQVQYSDLKGVLENLTRALGVRVSFEVSNEAYFDESCQGFIKLQGKVIGIAGKLSKTVLQNWDIKHQDVYFAGIDLQAISALPAPVIKFESLPEFPAVTRDVSLSVKKQVPYQEIETVCLHNSSDILRDVQFLEQYAGDKIEADRKAVVFSLVYQSLTRTLREEEVSAAHKRIVDALIQQLDAKLR
jgi:phenylalanyl-tRNA synthetase beta chain